ncbi:MAG: O-antigen ligase family protein [Bacteroidota bacterium]
MNLLLGLPVAAVGVLLLVYNYKPFFYLLLASIPPSVEIYFGGSSMDVASEPLMLLFLLLFIIELVAGRQFPRDKVIKPYHILVFLLLFWTLLTSITSSFPERSFKFLLAKLWYIAAFVFMAERLVKNEKTLKRLWACYVIPLTVLVVIITVKHAGESFSFESSNLISAPFFVNHVIYGVTTALGVPVAILAVYWYPAKDLRRYLFGIAAFIILIGAILSYARGAWLAVILSFICYWMIKWNLFSRAIYLALIVATLAVGYLIKDNNFYTFAPEYKTTIFHEGDLEGHLSATFDGTELSSMERFYRWVAAKNMIEAQPLLGFGPSTFNQVYKRYTDDAFRTYVSDNEEQSTTHNYFLMTFSEQGIVGGLLFIIICVYMLTKGQRVYLQASTPLRKSLVMCALLSIVVVLFHCLFNELIEVNKVGTMFWFNLTVIHVVEGWEEGDQVVSLPN